MMMGHLSRPVGQPNEFLSAVEYPARKLHLLARLRYVRIRLMHLRSFGSYSMMTMKMMTTTLVSVAQGEALTMSKKCRRDGGASRGCRAVWLIDKPLNALLSFPGRYP